MAKKTSKKVSNQLIEILLTDHDLNRLVAGQEVRATHTDAVITENYAIKVIKTAPDPESKPGAGGVYWNNVAAVAYTAYFAEMTRTKKKPPGPLTWNTWNELRPIQRAAWVRAIQEADRLLTTATLV
jgi:hypothetical protein